MSERRDRFDLGLYVVTDERVSRGRPTVEVVAAAIRGGADAIQLRSKELTAREQLALGRELRTLTRDAGVLFIVNDRADLAVALDADGVHVGQDDLPPEVARAIAGPGRIVGVSASSLDEARAGRDGGADYLGVGAIYGSTTKLDAGEAVGPALIAAIKAEIDLPVVGIGGITGDNLGQVIAAGADGVAIVGAVVGADDIEAAARDLKANLLAARADHRPGGPRGR